MAFTIPVYVAILTGRRFTDVISLHETDVAAIAQCRKWVAKAVDVQTDCVHPGYIYFAQYGTQDDTVRVEKHYLELQDTEDEDTQGEDDAPGIYTLTPQALELGYDERVAP